MAPSGGVAVKICGITSPEDLTAAEGADLVGVVVDVAGSPRSRTVAQARALFQRARGRYTTVAVVVDAGADRIAAVLEETGGDLVQVHGTLPYDLPKRLQGRVVPSLALPAAGSTGSAVLLSGPVGDFPWMHLDSSGGPVPGGTGRISDWSVAERMVREHPRTRFLLAGGLGPDNVAEALRRVRPAGVDVSSGVESRPGRKSREMIERFLAAVHAAPGAAVPSGGTP